MDNCDICSMFLFAHFKIFLETVVFTANIIFRYTREDSSSEFKSMPLNLKIRLYNLFVNITLLYGCESWTITKQILD
jgi:hypothetical protein